MPALKWHSFRMPPEEIEEAFDDPGSFFYERAEVEFFGAESLRERILDAWGKQVRGWPDEVNQELTPPRVTPGFLPGGTVAVADRDEQFLVIDAVWGDGTRVTYGEIDRALADRQLWGDVLDIGEVRRELSPDHDLQRNACELTFADPDGSFARRVADGSWRETTFELKIGSTRLPEFAWQRWGTWRIDRPTGHSPTSCSFALTDEADERLADEIVLPTLRDVAQLAGDFGTRLEQILFLDDRFKIQRFGDLKLENGDPAVSVDNEERRIPMALGDEFCKPGFVWVNYGVARDLAWGVAPARGAPGDALNPLAIVVLGASKRPLWETSRRAYSSDGGLPARQPILRDWEVWCTRTDRPNDAQDAEAIEQRARFKLFYPILGASDDGSPVITGSSTGLLPYIETYAIPDSLGFTLPPDRAANATWYVSVLYLCYASPSSGGLPSTSKEFRTQVGKALWSLYGAAQRDEVFVRTPGWGAEGRLSTQDSDHGPGEALQYLLDHHTALPRSAYAGTYGTSLASLKKADGLGRVGGHVAEDTPVGEVVAGLSRTWGVDVFVTRFGTLGFASAALSPEDYAYLQKYVRTYTDEHDIVRGSFSQRALVGNDREGQASVFYLRGLKEHTLLRNPWFDERFPLDAGVAALGRRIDKTLDVSWMPQPIGASVSGQLAPDLVERYAFDRSLVSLALPVYAVEDLAGWMRVTHDAWATADGRQDTTRTCRVVGVALRWKERVLAYDLIDEDDFAAGYRDYILDDEDLWSLAGTGKDPARPRRGGRSLTFTAASTTVATSWNPLTEMSLRALQVGDILFAWGSAHAGNRGPFRVTAVGSGSFDIDVAATDNEFLDSLSWELEASHETRLTYAHHPAAYSNPADPSTIAEWRPLPSTAYGAPGDDTVTGPGGAPGAFSSFEDGYQL